MRADRISQIMDRLRLSPVMATTAILDEIETSAPEATLEETREILRRLHDLAIADRNRRDRQRLT